MYTYHTPPLLETRRACIHPRSVTSLSPSEFRSTAVSPPAPALKIKFTSRPPPCFSQTHSLALRQRAANDNSRPLGSRNAIATLTQRWPRKKRCATGVWQPGTGRLALPAASRSATTSIRGQTAVAQFSNDRTLRKELTQAGRYGYARRSRVHTQRPREQRRRQATAAGSESGGEHWHACDTLCASIARDRLLYRRARTVHTPIPYADTYCGPSLAAAEGGLYCVWRLTSVLRCMYVLASASASDGEPSTYTCKLSLQACSYSKLHILTWSPRSRNLWRHG